MDSLALEFENNVDVDETWFDGVLEIIPATTSREQASSLKALPVIEEDNKSLIEESTTFVGRGFYDTDIILTEAKTSNQIMLGSGVLLQNPSTWGRIDESPRRFVVTAGHCVCRVQYGELEMYKQIRLRIPTKPWKGFPEDREKYSFGHTNMKDFYSNIMAKTEFIFVHPQYKGSWESHDIALIAIPPMIPTYGARIFRMHDDVSSLKSSAIVGFPVGTATEEVKSHIPYVSSRQRAVGESSHIEFKLNSTMVRYHSKTFQGMSGGAIVIDGNIIGIHTSGDSAENYGDGLVFTDVIVKWMLEKFDQVELEEKIEEYRRKLQVGKSENQLKKVWNQLKCDLTLELMKHQRKLLAGMQSILFDKGDRIGYFDDQCTVIEIDHANNTLEIRRDNCQELESLHASFVYEHLKIPGYQRSIWEQLEHYRTFKEGRPVMWLYDVDDESNERKYHYGLMQSNYGEYIGVRRYLDKGNEVMKEERSIHKDSLLMPFYAPHDKVWLLGKYFSGVDDVKECTFWAQKGEDLFTLKVPSKLESRGDHSKFRSLDYIAPKCGHTNAYPIEFNNVAIFDSPRDMEDYIIDISIQGENIGGYKNEIAPQVESWDAEFVEIRKIEKWTKNDGHKLIALNFSISILIYVHQLRNISAGHKLIAIGGQKFGDWRQAILDKTRAKNLDFTLTFYTNKYATKVEVLKAQDYAISRSEQSDRCTNQRASAFSWFGSKFGTTI